jgi:cell division protein FtsL
MKIVTDLFRKNLNARLYFIVLIIFSFWITFSQYTDYKENLEVLTDQVHLVAEKIQSGEKQYSINEYSAILKLAAKRDLSLYYIGTLNVMLLMAFIMNIFSYKLGRSKR